MRWNAPAYQLESPRALWRKVICFVCHSTIPWILKCSTGVFLRIMFWSLGSHMPQNPSVRNMTIKTYHLPHNARGDSRWCTGAFLLMECPGLSALCGTWYTSRPPWEPRVHLCRKVNCHVEISQTLGRMSSSLVAVESSLWDGVLEVVLWLTVVEGIWIKWKEITEIYIVFVPENHELLEYVFPLKFDSAFRRLNMSTIAYCTLSGMQIWSLTLCLWPVTFEEVVEVHDLRSRHEGLMLAIQPVNHVYV